MNKHELEIINFVDTLRNKNIDVRYNAKLMNGGAFIKINLKNGEYAEVICTDRTNWRFMNSKNCTLFGKDYRPGTYIVDISVFINDVTKYFNNEVDDNLLSLTALGWLKSVNYSAKTHEERMILIDAARIAYLY